MKKAVVFYRGSLLPLIFLLLGSASSAQSQDIFREMDQIKRELAETRNEVKILSGLVYEMRRVLLKSATAPPQEWAEKAPPRQTKPVEDKLDQEQVTKIVCSAVGTFFSETDEALRMNDADAAQSAVSKAFRKLTSSVKGYSRTHRVSKLLDIYEGLAWDTYTAVKLRERMRDKAEFIEMLNKHRQKFRDTCPRQ